MDDAPPRRIDVVSFLQFVKYGVVGASNTAITLIVYTVGVELGLTYELALVAGYILGGLNSYLLNRHWTFRAADIAHSRAGGRFALVQGVAIVVNAGLLYVLVHHLHVAKIPGQLILTVPVVLITFFINRKWTFGRPAGEPLASRSAVR
jgi:putative flippase GtrA